MMRIATTYRVTLLLCLLLLANPISRCAVMTAPATPSNASHCPEHSEPAPKNCAMTACCLVAKPVKAPAPLTEQGESLPALPVDFIPEVAGMGDHGSYQPVVAAQSDRYLAVRQLRI